VTSAAGLDVASLYVNVDLTQDLGSVHMQQRLRMIETVEGSPLVELALVVHDDALRPPNADTDAAARRFLDEALRRAEANDVTLLLYPHVNAWLEYVDHAVALCREYAHPRLAMTFAMLHWYALDGERLADRVNAAMPYLRMVNTNGSRHLSGRWPLPTVEPIGFGEFDNFAFLGMLRRGGYDGPLAVQGYSAGGDPYVSLQRSYRAVRDIEARLDRAPHWALLREDHI
jgi:sugar phosphate isomerase/epimerase